MLVVTKIHEKFKKHYENLVEIFPPVQICIFKNLYKRLNLNSFLSLKTSASIKTSYLNQIYFSFRYIAGGYAGGYKNPREIKNIF